MKYHVMKRGAHLSCRTSESGVDICSTAPRLFTCFHIERPCIGRLAAACPQLPIKTQLSYSTEMRTNRIYDKLNHDANNISYKHQLSYIIYQDIVNESLEVYNSRPLPCTVCPTLPFPFLSLFFPSPKSS